jgi:hypothetical protein
LQQWPPQFSLLVSPSHLSEVSLSFHLCLSSIYSKLCLTFHPPFSHVTTGRCAPSIQVLSPHLFVFFVIFQICNQCHPCVSIFFCMFLCACVSIYVRSRRHFRIWLQTLVIFSANTLKLGA